MSRRRASGRTAVDQTENHTANPAKHWRPLTFARSSRGSSRSGVLRKQGGIGVEGLGAESGEGGEVSGLESVGAGEAFRFAD